MDGFEGVPGQAFISYVREDSAHADRLQSALEAAGIPVWRDIANIRPGEDWRRNVRHAITNGSAVFIACFSRTSVNRSVSYQNEELTQAIELMRQRRPGDPWLIPVRFDDCKIPDLDLGAGRTLASIQSVDLFGERSSDGIARLIAAVLRILARGQHAVSAPTLNPPARPRDQWTAAAVSARPARPSEATPPPASADFHDYQTYKPSYVTYKPRVEGVVFNLGQNTGGLIVYASPSMRGEGVKAYRMAYDGIYANVVERTINGQREYAAIFSSVPAGSWTLSTKDDGPFEVTIFAGQIAEIDLRLGPSVKQITARNAPSAAVGSRDSLSRSGGVAAPPQKRPTSC